jgi:hypothetical protein
MLNRYQSNTAKRMLDSILSIQPKDSSTGGGETRESIVYRQASEFLEKLPPAYVPHRIKERYTAPQMNFDWTCLAGNTGKLTSVNLIAIQDC